MIRVTLQNIHNFELPLNTFDEVVKRGDSKRILKKLEKTYGLKSHNLFTKMFDSYELFCNAAHHHVPFNEKQLWLENYKIYVKSSVVYKFWIVIYKFRAFMGVQNLD